MRLGLKIMSWKWFGVRCHRYVIRYIDTTALGKGSLTMISLVYLYGER